MIDDEGSAARLVSLVLVFFEGRTALVLLFLPGLVHVIKFSLVVEHQVDVILLEDCTCLFVHSLNVEAGVKNKS